MVWMAQFVASETHQDFMIAFPNLTGTDLDLDYDEFHAMKLVCKSIMDDNEHIHISTFEEEDNTQIPKNPKNKKDREHMTPENKQLIRRLTTVAWLTVLFNGLICSTRTCSRRLLTESPML